MQGRRSPCSLLQPRLKEIEMMRHRRPYLLALLLLIAGAIAGQTTAPEHPQMTDGKVLAGIRFDGDYQRLDELKRRFAAQVVRFEPPRLYLLVDREQLPRLRQEGFEVRLLDPDEFFTHIVRVEPADEATLTRVRDLGGHLIQRESAFAIFQLNRRQLRLVQQQSLQVRPIRQEEPSPARSRSRLTTTTPLPRWSPQASTFSTGERDAFGDGPTTTRSRLSGAKG